MVGSPQADTIVGDSEYNRLDGGVGNDDLDAMGGPDEAFGGEGDDANATASRSKIHQAPKQSPPGQWHLRHPQPGPRWQPA